MELTEKIGTSTDLSLRLYIMFGPCLGCTHSICLANWHDGCGLCEGPIGCDYNYTKDILKYLNSSCQSLVELGRFLQEEVDCYNSLVLNGVFNLDCLLPEGRIYAYLYLTALGDILKNTYHKSTSSSHNQLEFIVWFQTRKIVMLEEECDDIYVSTYTRHHH